MSNNVTSKGQVTIPKAVRDHLGITAGTAVDFDLKDGEVVLRKADRERTLQRFEKMRGRYDFGMSTDQLMTLLRGDDQR